MKKGRFQLSLVLIMVILMVAACSPATATESNTEATTTVPEVDMPTTQAATDAAPMATEATGAGEAEANCAGVDTQALMASGQTLYSDQCASCHGEQGEGQGDFPALTANEGVTAENVTALITTYLSVGAHPKDVSPENLAAVLTYVRGSFGNAAAAVCPADIQIPAAQ